MHARLSLVLASLALASCAECGEVDCYDQLGWYAPVSASQYSEARAGTVRVCLEGDCAAAELASLPEMPPDLPGGGLPRSLYLREPSPAPDGGSTVWVGAWVEEGVSHLSVAWTRPSGTAADGDRFSIEVLAADGTTIVGLAETAVTYDRPDPNGCVACAAVILEGSTL